MSEYEDLMRRLGMSTEDSPAERDYTAANNDAELHYAAGKHLALHAAMIEQTLHLPKRRLLVVRAMKHLSPSAWREWWTLENEAFIGSVLFDLISVRSVFKDLGRWPELATLVDWIFVMAHTYRGRLLGLNSEELGMAQQVAVREIELFDSDMARTQTAQAHRILGIKGLDKRRVDMPGFLRATVRIPSRVDPWALAKHHDRIARG